MRLPHERDFWAGAMFAALGAGFVWASASHPVGAAAYMGPGYCPLWLGGMLGLLGAIIVARSFLSGAHEPRIAAFNWRLLILAFVPVALVYLLPRSFIEPVALRFGPAEYFSLMLFGLTGAAALAGGSLLKALAMTVLGMLLGLVGEDINSGVERFTFDVPEMAGGIDLYSVLLGALGIGLWAKLPKSRYRMGLLALLAVGVIAVYWREDGDAFFLLSTAVFGVAGYLWAKLKCVSAPLYFGLVFSALMEEHFRRALLLSRGNPVTFLTRPLSAAWLTLALLVLIWAALYKRRQTH
jgi:TctA family transporter